jgi:hypothetical protein
VRYFCRADEAIATALDPECFPLAASPKLADDYARTVVGRVEGERYQSTSSGDQKGRHVADKVPRLMTVGERLCRHDAGMHDTRPDRKGDQATMFGGVASSGYQIRAKHDIDPTDHLQIVLAMSAMPEHPRAR